MNASNFLPAAKIGWNFQGKSPISSGDPRFYVLPTNGALQVYSLAATDAGKVRAVAQVATGSKTKDQVFGDFQEVSVLSGKNTIIQFSVAKRDV